MAQPVLTPVKLTAVKTADGELLSGVVVEPKGRKRAAVIWVHGLGSAFDHGQLMMRLVSSMLSRQGIGFFKFDNRGSHQVVFGNGHRKYIGEGFERFTDCVKDIDAVIALARRLGYRKIFLAGHSTGASKIIFYTTKRPRTTRGLILLGAMSDIPNFIKRHGRAGWKAGLSLAKKIARKDPQQLMPSEYGIISAGRFLSMFTPGKPEDVFQWHNPKGKWPAVAAISQPLLFLVGSRDPYLDRPADRAVAFFKQQAKQSRSFESKVFIGSGHGFQDFQYDVARVITKWMQKQL